MGTKRRKKGKGGPQVAAASAQDPWQAGCEAASSGGPSGLEILGLLQKAKKDAQVEVALRKVLGPGNIAPEALAAPLLHCAGRGLATCVHLLIQAKAPVDHCDTTQTVGQQTPLQLAAGRGHVEVCRLLVERGANQAGAADAAQSLSKLGATFAQERKQIQAILCS